MKAYSIQMKTDTEAEVTLYGEVVKNVPVDFWTGEPVPGLFIALDQFVEDLDRLKTMSKVTFRINSVGGDADAGVTIYNRIKDLKGETVTIVDGLAASAASIIAQAGDKRIMNIGTQMMIHCAATLNPMYFRLSNVFDFMNSAELRNERKECQNAFTEAIKCVESADKAIASIYAEKTHDSADDVLNAMKEVKWMTAEEAVEEGYADEVAGADNPEAEATEGEKNKIKVNGITHYLRGIPMPRMAAMIMQKKTAESVDIDAHKNKNSEVIKMDLNELKEQFPDLVNQIRDEAVAENKADTEDAVKNAVAEAIEKDHERMKAIDSIANQVGDPELVNKAKYDEPISAEQLALKAMQKQAEAGKSFMDDRAKEMAASGTKDIVPEPVDGSEEETTAKDIADGAALIAGADWKEGK